MTRHPVVRGALSLSGSFGAVKGMERALRKYIPNEWLFKAQSSPTDMVPSVLEPTLVKSSPLQNGLNLTHVLSFMVDNIANMDVRIAVIIVLLTVVGPVMPYVFGFHKHVAQKAVEHLDPAQRALLQFGKSKSEPVLLSYVSMDLEEGEDFSERENTPAALRREEPRLEVEKKVEPVIEKVYSEVKPLQQLVEEPQEPAERDLTSQEESDGSGSAKQGSSGRSVCTLPSAQTSPLGRSDSYVSHSNVYIQFSPIKTSNLDAQLSSEQAYSQPFTY